jgi:hypothetical protein
VCGFYLFLFATLTPECTLLYFSGCSASMR